MIDIWALECSSFVESNSKIKIIIFDDVVAENDIGAFRDKNLRGSETPPLVMFPDQQILQNVMTIVMVMTGITFLNNLTNEF